jgi:hypothetical protein
MNVIVNLNMNGIPSAKAADNAGELCYLIVILGWVVTDSMAQVTPKWPRRSHGYFPYVYVTRVKNSMSEPFFVSASWPWPRVGKSAELSGHCVTRRASFNCTCGLKFIILLYAPTSCAMVPRSTTEG